MRYWEWQNLEARWGAAGGPPTATPGGSNWSPSRAELARFRREVNRRESEYRRQNDPSYSRSEESLGESMSRSSTREYERRLERLEAARTNTRRGGSTGYVPGGYGGASSGFQQLTGVQVLRSPTKGNPVVAQSSNGSATIILRTGPIENSYTLEVQINGRTQQKLVYY